MARKFYIVILCALIAHAVLAIDVQLYRVFEQSVNNDKSYSNKFNDVALEITWTSPSNKSIEFFGFFDGDGKGGGNKTLGNVWKFRFMPDKPGEWKYSWKFSDNSKSGSGSFTCMSKGAGKGIIRAYEKNRRWFAYNGTDPVFIKSYYTCDHLNEDVNWVSKNVWQKLIDRGYNHLQVAGLPIAYITETWDGEKGLLKKALMTGNNPVENMQLDVWKRVDELISWLNNKDIGIHLFQGFHGKKDKLVNFGSMSDSQKDFYVKYVVSRIGAFANISGWNYAWETGGNGDDLKLAKLIEKYDIFNHLRTYQDEDPGSNNYSNSAYTFAAIESHSKSSSGHYKQCMAAYKDKPVYMSEGNGLWRPCWGANADQIRRSAWGCVAAAASFCWQWVGKNCQEKTNPSKLFDGAGKYMDNLYAIMEKEVVFHTMVPHNDLLSKSDGNVFCLADPGHQYLVYEEGGGSFSLKVDVGTYKTTWFDTKTGDKTSKGETSGSGSDISFETPNKSTDWVLILRTGDAPTSVRRSPAQRFSIPALSNMNAQKAYRIDGRLIRGAGSTSAGIRIIGNPQELKKIVAISK